MLDTIKAQVDALFPDIVQLRRTLHRYPELSMDEHATAQRVADALNALDEFDVQTGVHETGVIATLAGGQPGPTVLLRADMDALPIHEETELDFASEHDGVMHACGHDAHTASLLGAAQILHALRDRVHGHVRFLFQPSEERIPGGAKFMIEEGALEANATSPAPDAAFGQHVRPDLSAGTIGVRSGMFMASTDELFITVRGEGGHAATPHELEADPTLVASHIVVALQSIVSRHCPPDVPSVLTIGKLIADGATNVIPAEARMEGTFRAMDEDWRRRGHTLIRRTVQHTAEAYGATADVEIAEGYPALYNHEASTELVQAAAEAYVGASNTVELGPWFAGEDFAYFLQKCPGTFYTLGVRNEAEGITHPLHTSRFTIDETALRVGAGFMAYLAWQYGAQNA